MVYKILIFLTRFKTSKRSKITINKNSDSKFSKECRHKKKKETSQHTREIEKGTSKILCTDDNRRFFYVFFFFLISEACFRRQDGSSLAETFRHIRNKLMELYKCFISIPRSLITQLMTRKNVKYEKHFFLLVFHLTKQWKVT